MTPESFLRLLERDLGRPPGSLTPDTELGKLATWDSMAVLMVISLADAEFGKTITGVGIRSAHTPAELFSLIENAPMRA